MSRPSTATHHVGRSLLTLDEARSLLRISKWSLQQLIHDRRLQTMQIGRRRFVHPDDLDDLIERLRQEGRDGR